MPTNTPPLQSCPRCQKTLECRPDAIAQCPCSKVTLSSAAKEYIKGQYRGCLCVSCLLILNMEYHEMLEKMLWPLE